ncbi:hypothetical protein [Alteromonas facilis]|uniref:hypothetical protein n=1 Tax=Alteromonas facilis TaxID=2048004 RepID=UPI000C287422|nr:hypothetical protein [Alteromonas facilis]
MFKLHKIKLTFIAVISLLTLFGCSSSSGPFIPVAQYTSDTALFVYSPIQVRNAHTVPVVKINGSEVTRLSNGALAIVNLTPGLHEIALYKMDTPFEVDQEAFYIATFTIQQGERLYFRWQEDKTYDVSLTADSLAGPMDYRFVPSTMASNEISESKIKTVSIVPTIASISS